MDNMEKDVSMESSQNFENQDNLSKNRVSVFPVEQVLTKQGSFSKPQHFKVKESRVERMVSVILTEQANCLTALGRLGEAIEKYDEAIVRSEKLKDNRQVAMAKGQLATVQMMQKKYAEAVAGHKEALAIFEKQDEPKMVATAWHQIGRVHQEAGDYESAEAAYRRSLEIRSQNNDRAGQANSLNQLGLLYKNTGRLEEAIIFYRQAADIFAELGDIRYEGIARSNIANTLVPFKRYDEARAEIMRAIECKSQVGLASEPWTSFAILQEIEEATGNPTAARAAWAQGRDAYLAYRRQGGYAQGEEGQLIDQLLGMIQQGQSGEVMQFLEQAPKATDTPDWIKVLAPKILAILGGSRDVELGDDPAFDYRDAAEVLFLIERLGN